MYAIRSYYADLEEHVLHDVALEWLRIGERPAPEQHVVESPGSGRERRRIAHLAGQRDQCVTHRPARRITRRPALARSGVGRMTVGPERTAVDPGSYNFV